VRKFKPVSNYERKMALSKRTREQLLAHCGEIHDDDNIDPRAFFKASRPQKKETRKAKQLCRQVAETLDQLLSGEASDDALRGVRVADVLPAPDTSRLLVTLLVDCDPAAFDRSLIEERLAQAKGRLRSQVASAITRRKAPTLVFEVIGPELPRSIERMEDNQ
jgi:ribosome-binding factor A